MYAIISVTAERISVTSNPFFLRIEPSDLTIGSLFPIAFGELTSATWQATLLGQSIRWMTERQCVEKRSAGRIDTSTKGEERTSRWRSMTRPDLPSRYRTRYRCEELWKSAGGLSSWPSYIISKGSLPASTAGDLCRTRCARCGI